MNNPLVASEVCYRRLKLGESAQLRELNAVFARAFEDEAKHLSNPASEAYLNRLLAKDDFVAVVALEGGRVIGGLVAYVLEKVEQEHSELYLYDIAVDEPFRRRGVARRLIQESVAIAKSIGAIVVFVQADREDEPAVKLYESLGSKIEPFHFEFEVP